MRNDEQKPKTQITGRPYYENELIEAIKDQPDFQRGVDLYKEDKLDKLRVSFKAKEDETKDHITISNGEITREIVSNCVSPEVREKVSNDLKKKDKIKDVFPVNSYTFQ